MREVTDALGVRGGHGEGRRNAAVGWGGSPVLVGPHGERRIGQLGSVGEGLAWSVRPCSSVRPWSAQVGQVAVRAGLLVLFVCNTAVALCACALCRSQLFESGHSKHDERRAPSAAGRSKGGNGGSQSQLTCVSKCMQAGLHMYMSNSNRLQAAGGCRAWAAGHGQQQQQEAAGHE
ncbi:hypothetical protein HaLaN_30467 [Haematococcus lacustris]|uniref:Uncharacterized protein n=1 Tax=Haematococcus lacustris TaxID=44745 RepID=A0A6A0AFJ5_HAELA|nr:hypothetical protein HaLaN_30467 [Haematococcus lacustris]